MRSIVFVACLTTFGVASSSCNSSKSIANIQKVPMFKNKKNGSLEPTLITINTDATQRFGIVMVNKDGRFITFSENPPDAAIQTALAVLGKADVDGKTAGKVSAEAKLDFAKTIAELGKRSEAINFHRDGMFRLSEMFNNQALTPAQLVVLIDSLQCKTERMSAVTATRDIETAKLDKIKELNKLLEMADSSAKKLTPGEVAGLLKEK